MRQPLLWIAVFLCWALPGRAQVDLSARLDSNDIMIGDQVRLDIRITARPGVQVLDTDLTPLDTSRAIEVLAAAPWDTTGREGTLTLQQRITLTSFEPGEHVIPSLEIRYKAGVAGRLLRTEPLALRVRDLPPAQDPNQLMPIKPIVEEPLRFQDILPYLLGFLGLVLLLVILFFILRRRRQGAAAVAPEVSIPPHLLALQKLKTLREKELWKKGESKAFQSELSHILREYLENRFHLPALEMTSGETLRRLPELDLDPAWQDRLRDVFQVADLVKFAKAEPAANLHEEALRTVEDFVKQTTPREEEEGEENSDT